MIMNSNPSHTYLILHGTFMADLTRYVYYPAETNVSGIGSYRVDVLQANSDTNFNFVIPDDFVSLNSLSLIGWAQTGAGGNNKNVDLTSTYGRIGENVLIHSETNTVGLYTFGPDYTKFALNLASVFTQITAGDICGVNVKHNSVGGNVSYVVIKLSYQVG